MKKQNQVATPEYFPFNYIIFINSVSDCRVDELATGSPAFPQGIRETKLFPRI
jgi:hypothetical protein